MKVTSCIPQLHFSFYRSKRIQVDFCGGQLSGDAGLLPLRAFDQRHRLTLSLAEHVSDPREGERVRHSVLSLFCQRIYQIIAGYEDANDADRLRHDPAFQILADQPLGEPLGSQPTLSRWENSPSPRDLLKLQDALLDWFVKICGKQVRKRGEILLDVDSTDDPTGKPSRGDGSGVHQDVRAAGTAVQRRRNAVAVELFQLTGTGGGR